MKIITWNIRCQNETDNARGCGWAVRRESLCAILNRQAPDILATQEGYAPQIDDLCAALPDYQMAGIGRNDGKRAGEFCAIFWRGERYELRAQKTQWLSLSPAEPSFGWGAHCVRIVTKARLFDRQTEREFEVWNAHFDHASALARLESAKLLQREIAALDVPALLCGDFNCAPDDEPLLALTANGDLRDSRFHSAQPPLGPHATFCGFADYTSKIEAPIGGEGARIDYVLATRDWNIESYATLPTDENAKPVSDHRPVVVEIALS